MWVLGALLIGMIAVITGCGALVFVFLGVVTAPVDAVNEYFEALSDGNDAEAREFLCRELRDDDLYPPGEIDSYNFNSSSVTNNVGVVDGSVVIDGSARPMSLDVVKEDDEWRVCGFASNLRVDNTD